MVEVCAGVWRVLRDDGTFWINCGDAYANDSKWGGTTGGKHVSALHGEPIGRAKRQTGLKPKDLCLMPFRLALALQEAGWYVRSDICWAKKSPMPESVTDRPTSAWEHIFLLSKSKTYYYDAEAVRQPVSPGSLADPRTERGQRGTVGEYGRAMDGNCGYDPSGANLRNVWHLGGKMLRLRSDLTPEQRACVLERLAGIDRGGHA